MTAKEDINQYLYAFGKLSFQYLHQRVIIRCLGMRWSYYFLFHT